MAVSMPESGQSTEKPSRVFDALSELERSGSFQPSDVLDVLERFWDTGDREESAAYFKKYFWLVWFQLDIHRLQGWHNRFCEIGRPSDSPYLAGALLPFLSSSLRFSIAQLASMSLGEDAVRLQEIALGLGSADTGVMRASLVASNDKRNKFDSSTGYSVGSSMFFPAANAIGEIIYDSGLDGFDDSMSVEVIPYYRESAMLETRLAAHDGRFDSILLVEGATDYQGKSKPSYFMQVFDEDFRLRNRIRHIIVEFPQTDDPWVRERLQRDAAVSLLAPLDPNAMIFSSDLDELFDVGFINYYREICRDGPVAVTSILITHCLSNIARNSWLHPKMFLRKHMPESLSALRLIAGRIGPLAGWHLTYFGDEKFIADKLNAFAHTENEPDPSVIFDSVKGAQFDSGTVEIYKRLPVAVRDRWSRCALHDDCSSVSVREY